MGCSPASRQGETRVHKHPDRGLMEGSLALVGSCSPDSPELFPALALLRPVASLRDTSAGLPQALPNRRELEAENGQVSLPRSLTVGHRRMVTAQRTTAVKSAQVDVALSCQTGSAYCLAAHILLPVNPCPAAGESCGSPGQGDWSPSWPRFGALPGLQPCEDGPGRGHAPVCRYPRRLAGQLTVRKLFVYTDGMTKLYCEARNLTQSEVGSYLVEVDRKALTDPFEITEITATRDRVYIGGFTKWCPWTALPDSMVVTEKRSSLPKVKEHFRGVWSNGTVGNNTYQNNHEAWAVGDQGWHGDPYRAVVKFCPDGTWHFVDRDGSKLD